MCVEYNANRMTAPEVTQFVGELTPEQINDDHESEFVRDTIVMDNLYNELKDRGIEDWS
jgi:hypothetical protein